MSEQALRMGRRPGDPEVTRQAILDAARTEFAEAGYERATIRAIAARAGVDPALVHHHFGSKEDLFVTAHEFPFNPSIIQEALGEGEGTLGERLARSYLTIALQDERIEALIRSAATNDMARDMLRGFVQSALLDAFEEQIEGPDARLRMALAAAQLIGVVMMRRIVGVDAVVDADVETIVERVAPVLDHHLGRAAG